MGVLGEGTQSIPDRVAELLRCPTCGHHLADTDGGSVGCDRGHRFLWRDGYLDFSQEAVSAGSTGRTFASFGYEWNAFDEVRDEDQQFAEIYFRDLDLAGLGGKVGLDAGCGKGRFTRVLASYLDAEVALDGSSAVEAAGRNLADQDNVLVVKSDLRCAPFALEGFDFISSLGVLHHLDDPFEGFKRLVGLLAPNGQILLYLYSRPATAGIRSVALKAATLARRVTVRMSHPMLRRASTPVAGCLYAVFVLPGRWGQTHGVEGLSRLPMDTYRDKPFRSLVLDTFDRLSAPVEHRYVWTELAPWFAETGLVVDAARDETGWFVLAHRP
jgi:SAM-dependent methyltransferase